MSQDSFSQCILGEHDEMISCIGEEQHQQAIVQLVAQAERHIDILTHNFSPEIYDNPLCFEVFEALALRSRHSRIRILIQQPKQVAQRGHSLLSSAQRVSSSFILRRPIAQYRTIEESFLIVDGLGFIHCPYRDALKSEVNFKDAYTAKSLQKLFDKVWQASERDAYLNPSIL